ncbi:hypothetical protein AB4142_26640 [Variovorax sp. 2RAF20]|uniref:8-oxoguanine DNA glycosylase OGG fold protein n=1 Tax=unclassified Variovorax TaxID=663243 RepID=UPI000BD54C27|nr:hypothetical protein [Variovorax sp. YR752]SOE06410.1 hypothetical protein SAMN05518800_7062 [Variovorax sp. YR752]
MIAAEHDNLIRTLNVDEHRTVIHYAPWVQTFKGASHLLEMIDAIKDGLGDSWTRSDLTKYYARADVASEQKFVAAMVWGHEAAAEGRRDNRGPWKVATMFKDAVMLKETLRGMDVASDLGIEAAYKRFKDIPRCGTSFLTKHLYFLGKADGGHRYPLIFDNRVAAGLLKLQVTNPLVFDMVDVGVARTPRAYLAYLRLARQVADRAQCEMDQVEYFLFTH